MDARKQPVKKLAGANMDIDLIPADSVPWKQAACPWNKKDGRMHKCATKNTKICPYFCGIDYPDRVLCSYPAENPLRKK